MKIWIKEHPQSQVTLEPYVVIESDIDMDKLSGLLDRETRFEEVTAEMRDLYTRKNADYGDSFHKTFMEEGIAMPRIRLTDKLNRFKTLTRSTDQQVADETIRDTLLDLACYAVMTVMEMEGTGWRSK